MSDGTRPPTTLKEYIRTEVKKLYVSDTDNGAVFVTEDRKTVFEKVTCTGHTKVYSCNRRSEALSDFIQPKKESTANYNLVSDKLSQHGGKTIVSFLTHFLERGQQSGQVYMGADCNHRNLDISYWVSRDENYKRNLVEALMLPHADERFDLGGQCMSFYFHGIANDSHRGVNHVVQSSSAIIYDAGTKGTYNQHILADECFMTKLTGKDFKVALRFFNHKWVKGYNEEGQRILDANGQSIEMSDEDQPTAEDLVAFCELFTDHDFKTEAGWKAFLAAFDLKFISDNIPPKTPLEDQFYIFGKALRACVPMRITVYDGQHRFFLMAYFLTGFYEPNNKVAMKRLHFKDWEQAYGTWDSMQLWSKLDFYIGYPRVENSTIETECQVLREVGHIVTSANAKEVPVTWKEVVDGVMHNMRQKGVVHLGFQNYWRKFHGNSNSWLNNQALFYTELFGVIGKDTRKQRLFCGQAGKDWKAILGKMQEPMKRMPCVAAPPFQNHVGIPQVTGAMVQLMRACCQDMVSMQRFGGVFALQNPKQIQRGDLSRRRLLHFRDPQWLYRYLYCTTYRVAERFEKKVLGEIFVIKFLRSTKDPSLQQHLFDEEFQNGGLLPEGFKIPKYPTQSKQFVRTKMQLSNVDKFHNKIIFSSFTGILLDILESIAEYGFDPDFTNDSVDPVNNKPKQHSETEERSKLVAENMAYYKKFILDAKKLLPELDSLNAKMYADNPSPTEEELADFRSQYSELENRLITLRSKFACDCTIRKKIQSYQMMINSMKMSITKLGTDEASQEKLKRYQDNLNEMVKQQKPYLDTVTAKENEVNSDYDSAIATEIRNRLEADLNDDLLDIDVPTFGLEEEEIEARKPRTAFNSYLRRYLSEAYIHQYPTFMSQQLKKKTPGDDDSYGRKWSIEVLLQLYIETVLSSHPLTFQGAHKLDILKGFEGDPEHLCVGKGNHAHGFTPNNPGGFQSNESGKLNDLSSIIPSGFKFSNFVYLVLNDKINTNDIPAFAAFYKKHTPSPKKKSSGDKDDDGEDEDDEEEYDSDMLDENGNKVKTTKDTLSKGMWMSQNIKEVLLYKEDGSNDANAEKYLPLLFKLGVIKNITFNASVLKRKFRSPKKDPRLDELFEETRTLQGGWKSTEELARAKKAREAAEADGPDMETPMPKISVQRTDSPESEDDIAGSADIPLSAKPRNLASVLTEEKSPEQINDLTKAFEAAHTPKVVKPKKQTKRKAPPTPDLSNKTSKKQSRSSPRRPKRNQPKPTATTELTPGEVRPPRKRVDGATTTEPPLTPGEARPPPKRVGESKVDPDDVSNASDDMDADVNDEPSPLALVKKRLPPGESAVEEERSDPEYKPDGDGEDEEEDDEEEGDA